MDTRNFLFYITNTTRIIEALCTDFDCTFTHEARKGYGEPQGLVIKIIKHSSTMLSHARKKQIQNMLPHKPMCQKAIKQKGSGTIDER